MRHLIALTIFFVCAQQLLAQVPSEGYVWKGFEIVGQKNVLRNAIIAEIPIKIGTSYTDDRPAWDSICAGIQKKFGFYDVYCETVRYLDFRAYFLVNVVERGDESHTRYRPKPTGDVPLASPEVVRLYDALMTRLWDLFAQGKSAGEQVHGDYLDFTDPKMHEIVLQLIRKTPSFRDNLVEVIRDDASSDKRSKAAWLLCWALNPEQSIAEVYQYMDDPSVEGRNDIVRFMSHWVAQIGDGTLRHKIVDKLAAQMNHPSHADRNKALWGLQEIAKNSPEAWSYLREHYRADIEYIASTSILENVGGIARDILAIIDSPARP